MAEYVFSDATYRAVWGKPKGKDVWCFGDINGSVTVVAGSKEKPLSLSEAQRVAFKKLDDILYPYYKTVYLLPKIHPCDYKAKELLSVCMEKEKEGSRLCPRCCGKLRPALELNPRSRYADVYICSSCREDEEKRDETSTPLPLHKWAVFLPNKNERKDDN